MVNMVRNSSQWCFYVNGSGLFVINNWGELLNLRLQLLPSPFLNQSTRLFAFTRRDKLAAIK